MFFGILLRPLLALVRFGSPANGGDVPENSKSHLRLRWERGNDGHPRAHWTASETRAGGHLCVRRRAVSHRDLSQDCRRFGLLMVPEGISG